MANAISTAQRSEIKEHFVYQKLSQLVIDHEFSRMPRWISSDFNASKVIGAPGKSERKLR